MYNIILGLNMLKHRRYLTMNDLLCTDLGELINTRDFACPPKVKERIREIERLGVSGFIRKPFQPEQLRDALIPLLGVKEHAAARNNGTDRGLF